jgi:hypothetical protein
MIVRGEADAALSRPVAAEVGQSTNAIIAEEEAAGCAALAAAMRPPERSCGFRCAVFRSARHDHRDRHKGLLSVRYETSPDVELVTYPPGGCLHRTSAANLTDHVAESARAIRGEPADP